VGAGAIELVRHAIEVAGFLGVKVYPPVGFAPAGNGTWLAGTPREAEGHQIDLALDAFFAYCEAEEVPITTHASVGNLYALGFENLVRPQSWGPVLKRHPKLRLNLGHFGHDEGIDDRRGLKACEAWMRQAFALIERYENVYADMANSALAYDDAYAKRYLGYLAQLIGGNADHKLTRRIMFGSDWWLNRLGPKSETFPEKFAQHFHSAEGALGPSITRNVMGYNALRFLGFIDDQNRVRDGRAAGRLRSFYGEMPKPAWLAP
jgi:predicted TIM-barrel fold metal-dependent hydrolase